MLFPMSLLPEGWRAPGGHQSTFALTLSVGSENVTGILGEPKAAPRVAPGSVAQGWNAWCSVRAALFPLWRESRPWNRRALNLRQASAAFWGCGCLTNTELMIITLVFAWSLGLSGWPL